MSSRLILRVLLLPALVATLASSVPAQSPDFCSSPVMSIASGNNQSGPPSAFLPQPLVVGTVCENGQALIAPITFTSKTGGFSETQGGTPESSLTVQADSKGFATVYFFTADEFSVASTITATAQHYGAVADVQFTAETSAPPAVVTKVSGDAQTVVMNGLSTRPLEVIVTVNGQPMVDTPITFSVTNGEGLLTSDVTPGAPAAASLIARTDYAGRIRPPVGPVFFKAGTETGSAAVTVTANGPSATFSLEVTEVGPLAAPQFFRATDNPDGSKLFEWDPPLSGFPTGVFVALLGRNQGTTGNSEAPAGATGQWQTITTLEPPTTYYLASTLELAPFTEYAVRVQLESGKIASALSNTLGAAAARPSYAVVNYDWAQPLAVASDGTVILNRENYNGFLTGAYRTRGGVNEYIGGGTSFLFQAMTDRGDIIGGELIGNDMNYTATAIFAEHSIGERTRWAQRGSNLGSGSFLYGMNSERTVVGYSVTNSVGGTFVSSAPNVLNYIPQGAHYEVRDLNNHGGMVGYDYPDGVHWAPLYYGAVPHPVGDSAFDPYATNDDGLVLGASDDTIRLWEPLAATFRSLRLPIDFEFGYYAQNRLKVTDPPTPDSSAPTYILAGRNLIIRSWKDADGVPSPYPIHTVLRAEELFPAGSPYYDIYLKDVSNNGLVVAWANSHNDSRSHALLLLPLSFQARDGRINFGFDPPMNGLPNTTPPVLDDPPSEPAWASVVTETPSANVKFVPTNSARLEGPAFDHGRESIHSVDRSHRGRA